MDDGLHLAQHTMMRCNEMCSRRENGPQQVKCDLSLGEQTVKTRHPTAEIFFHEAQSRADVVDQGLISFRLWLGLLDSLAFEKSGCGVEEELRICLYEKSTIIGLAMVSLLCTTSPFQRARRSLPQRTAVSRTGGLVVSRSLHILSEVLRMSVCVSEWWWRRW